MCHVQSRVPRLRSPLLLQMTTLPLEACLPLTEAEAKNVCFSGALTNTFPAHLPAEARSTAPFVNVDEPPQDVHAPYAIQWKLQYNVGVARSECALLPPYLGFAGKTNHVYVSDDWRYPPSIEQVRRAPPN